MAQLRTSLRNISKRACNTQIDDRLFTLRTDPLALKALQSRVRSLRDARSADVEARLERVLHITLSRAKTPRLLTAGNDEGAPPLIQNEHAYHEDSATKEALSPVMLKQGDGERLAHGPSNDAPPNAGGNGKAFAINLASPQQATMAAIAAKAAVASPEERAVVARAMIGSPWTNSLVAGLWDAPTVHEMRRCKSAEDTARFERCRNVRRERARAFDEYLSRQARTRLSQDALIVHQ